MTTPNAPAPSQKGIDIRDAISILSTRAKDGGNDQQRDVSSVSDDMKRMGQTLDISGDDVAASSPAVDEKEEERHQAMKRERERRADEIRSQLKSMGVVDLLGMIFRAQHERVATYKLFEEGLSTILASGNISNYPTLCAKVTASFSVLSDTINTVKSSFTINDGAQQKQPNKKDITNAISQLQKSEGEKLNLTAALHLERLRLRNSQLEKEMSLVDDGNGSASADRTVELLKDGIRTLERKIGSVVEEINEVLEELRCVAADESEE
eukprot:CAMPEP_0201603652 /NCGR_PEP_ID=MMETSP0492-20130828/4036_1 /ASSEMBLY_ACC=CAM_ASM_000837 /TAXON_ID=420259 /ORGANISM="Thalassiosira gravida, Strain GMp14c1" /LENGTH=266 /DNA_ID=CAMNT_0048067479 /DNA_START=82 /DNA_END=882 /DNA_ORIENTATION=+